MYLKVCIYVYQNVSICIILGKHGEKYEGIDTRFKISLNFN